MYLSNKNGRNKITRFEYLTRDLNELEKTEQELELNGIPRAHIHVLSEDEAELQYRSIPSVPDFLKKNVVRSGFRGLLVGSILGTVALTVPYLLGWHLGATWAPFIVLAMMIVGFCTWEGGMIGLHKTNERLARYQPYVSKGSHLLMIDVTEDEKTLVDQTMRHHPRVHRINKTLQ